MIPGGDPDVHRDITPRACSLRHPGNVCLIGLKGGAVPRCVDASPCPVPVLFHGTQDPAPLPEGILPRLSRPPATNCLASPAGCGGRCLQSKGSSQSACGDPRVAWQASHRRAPWVKVGKLRSQVYGFTPNRSKAIGYPLPKQQSGTNLPAVVIFMPDLQGTYFNSRQRLTYYGQNTGKM